jgi:hypothetical protein
MMRAVDLQVVYLQDHSKLIILSQMQDILLWQGIQQ